MISHVSYRPHVHPVLPPNAPERHLVRRNPPTLIGYVWAVAGVTLATALFWLQHGALDAAQAPLLYLPVVLVCAVRFGFGPAVMAAFLSFFCWDYFFIPPIYNALTNNPRNWVSLFIFLMAAITTAHLASDARGRAEEAEARERETVMLYQASEVISREVESERLLRALVEQVMQTCRVSRCLIFQRLPPNQPLTSVAAAADEPLSPACEHLIRRKAEAVAGQSSREIPAGEEAGLYVPLRVQNASLGVLYVGPRRDGVGFSQQDERLILTLANHAAVVIARQRLVEEAKQQARQAAVLEERNRLAREVHDTLSHAFTGIKFMLEAAQRVGSTEQAAECIVHARRLATEGAQEARRSVWALRPAALEQAGDLVSAIKQMALQQTAETPVQLDVSIVGQAHKLPDLVEDNLLRISQEAVTNVLRHAHATRVAISLIFETHEVVLSIKDDGCGFLRDEPKARDGFGLTSMDERSAQIQGTLAIESQPNRGTEVIAHIPFRAEVRE